MQEHFHPPWEDLEVYHVHVLARGVYKNRRYTSGLLPVAGDVSLDLNGA